MAIQTPAELFRSSDPAAGIVFDDCLAILQERAKLFVEYRVDIRRRFALMREACPEQVNFEIAARAFIEAIGKDIPDRAIKVGVKRLAMIEFENTGAT